MLVATHSRSPSSHRCRMGPKGAAASRGRAWAAPGSTTDRPSPPPISAPPPGSGARLITDVSGPAAPGTAAKVSPSTPPPSASRSASPSAPPSAPPSASGMRCHRASPSHIQRSPPGSSQTGPVDWGAGAGTRTQPSAVCRHRLWQERSQRRPSGPVKGRSWPGLQSRRLSGGVFSGAPPAPRTGHHSPNSVWAQSVSVGASHHSRRTLVRPPSGPRCAIRARGRSRSSPSPTVASQSCPSASAALAKPAVTASSPSPVRAVSQAVDCPAAIGWSARSRRIGVLLVSFVAGASGCSGSHR